MVLNYVQHIFPVGAKKFVGGDLHPCAPLVTGLVECSNVASLALATPKPSLHCNRNNNRKSLKGGEFSAKKEILLKHTHAG